MSTQPYETLLSRLSAVLPDSQIIHDPLRRLSLGTDASFYRLIPRIVIRVESEQEVIAVIRETRQLHLPITFRAAGTSLSGQAVSDSVLVMLGSQWTGHSINEDATQIRLQPGIIGSHANLFLAPHGRKIGPDPASINSAMIGGIAANNASGMCCGTAQNSYRTLQGMRIVFADGSVLDTSSEEGKAAFARTHGEMLNRITDLAQKVRQNTPLADRIRQKFRMKNTTGYSLNALVDFDDPFDIIQHLMIGSEGTLGFIAEITYRTVPELPFKASALMIFPNIATACKAVAILKSCPVDAVELMDRPSLRSVENKPGMPAYLKDLDAGAASLLVETRASAHADLLGQTEVIAQSLEGVTTVRPIEFTENLEACTRLWNIRKGLFPSVGAMRATGTTVIIEDVAFPVPLLAQATMDLQLLFRKHGYEDAIIFGHALEGNLHFVFKQDFGSSTEVERYRGFLEDVAALVVRKYDGSLKAEHGTGRNMAPFVALEWGAEAFQLMKEIKQVFDPANLLNPGVILNPDPMAHITNLKPLPPASDEIDKCIECGFCEVHCPSKNLTMTPRQRIVAFREIARLTASREDDARLEEFRKAFPYLADETCATDGLCATSCPVEIDTGKLVKTLRLRQHSPTAHSIADVLSDHMSTVTHGMRIGLHVVDVLHTVLGTRLMQSTSNLLRRASGNAIPLWNPAMPGGADPLPMNSPTVNGKPAVVYFPTCINRSMGVAKGDEDHRSLTTAICNLLHKAGYDVLFPENLTELCCGMAFASKGFKEQGDRKAKELEKALRRASHEGQIPILVDMSPCLYRMKEAFAPGLNLYEPVRFILDRVVDRLEISKLPITVAVHTTCSAEKMGLNAKLRELASRCAERVLVPRGVGCCGWAGDRGFTVPELNASALMNLKKEIPEECKEGYSTSRTCEIGLSLHSGIPYQSIVYLVDRASRERNSAGESAIAQ
jgi:D-lactate dehydrogenase